MLLSLLAAQTGGGHVLAAQQLHHPAQSLPHGCIWGPRRARIRVCI